MPMFDYYGELSQRFKADVFKVMGFVFFTPAGQTGLHWVNSGFHCDWLFALKVGLSLIMIHVGCLSFNYSATILIRLDKFLELKKQKKEHNGRTKYTN